MRRQLILGLIITALFISACGGQAAPTAAPAPAQAPTEQPTAAPVPPTATPEAAQPTATTETKPTEAPTAAPTEAPAVAPTKEAASSMGAIALPEVNPLEVSGDVISAGSSTVFPLAEAVTELFINEGYGGNITIDSIGTGAGFERFCKAGETDVANASRPIKDSEVESCKAIGREPLAFRVGTDALAVVVNPANDWIGEDGVTKEQLAKIFSSETTNWSDVDPAWPNQPIKRFSPGTDSGTFDYFVEAVMNPVYVKDAEADKGKGEQQILGAKNLQLSEDDNVLVQGVAGDEYAIGYFGFAYYVENKGKVRDIAIEGVAPSDATVNAGEYPLARPLFLYSSANIMQEKQQVADYIDFFLSNVDSVISKVGYFPASEQDLNQAKQTWLDAMGMEAGAMEAEPAAGSAIALPEVNPLEVSGDVISAGSSTVFPLAETVTELFINEGYGGNITIDSIGTGAGFERFCKAGETDVANASRPIKDSEIESCKAIGREPIEFRVGTDALAVVVNPANDWIGPEGVTKEQLAKIFSSETTNWSDVDPAWPAQPIKRFSPGTDSGTFDYFVEAVMDPVFVVDKEADKGKGEQQILGAKNLQLSEDDNVLVQGVSGDEYAIGYFGFAYFEENAAKLRDLAIEGVNPTADTVNAGDYSLARPLFIYSTAKIMQEKPQVADYINFFLSNVDSVISKVGYFPASDEALSQAKQAWLDAMGQ